MLRETIYLKQAALQMHLNNNKRKAQCLTNQLATSKNGFGNLSQQKDGGINDKRKVANLLHRVTFSK